jgi:hypothetical protein
VCANIALGVHLACLELFQENLPTNMFDVSAGWLLPVRIFPHSSLSLSYIFAIFTHVGVFGIPWSYP